MSSASVKNTYNQCVITVHCMTILQSYLQGYLRAKYPIECLNCPIQEAEASEPLWNQGQPGLNSEFWAKTATKWGSVSNKQKQTNYVTSCVLVLQGFLT